MPFQRDPKFGHDAWLNPATQPDPNADHLAIALGGASVYTGADTIGSDIRLLPNGLNMYASYVDNFGGYGALVSRFGANFAGLLLSITIFGNVARCADVEPGAMHAASLPAWLDHKALRDGGQLPWVYTSASNMSSANAVVGARKVIRWSAHYGFGPHVCGPHTCGWPQADWTQWDDKGPAGQNFDRSIGLVLPHGVAKKVDPVAKGKARALVTIDLATGAGTVHGLPGVVSFQNQDAELASRITVSKGGKFRGHWTIAKSK